MVAAARSLLYLLAVALSPACSVATAAERDWQEPWCEAQGGVPEVSLPDRTRVDCVTATHAVEVDWARKWAEAIGQSQHYATMTGLKPGIVLLIDGDNDARFVTRLRRTTDFICPKTTIWLVDTSISP